MATYADLKKRVKSGQSETQETQSQQSSYADLKKRAKQEKFAEDVKKVDSSYINIFTNEANSIPSFKRLSEGENVVAPITLPLLNKYGVTKEKFIKDFNDKGLVLIPN